MQNDPFSPAAIKAALAPELFALYATNFAVDILFYASSLSGSYNSEWYKGLRKAGLSSYLVDAAWIIADILSYGATIFLWGDSPASIEQRAVILNLYLGSNFLNLLWGVTFWQGNNLPLATWIAALLFIYNFYILVYIFRVNPWAALFLLPLILMYAYLFYSMVHLANLNGIIL